MVGPIQLAAQIESYQFGGGGEIWKAYQNDSLHHMAAHLLSLLELLLVIATSLEAIEFVPIVLRIGAQHQS